MSLSILKCNSHQNAALIFLFQGSSVWAFPLMAWRSVRGWTRAHSGHLLCEIWTHRWVLFCYVFRFLKTNITYDFLFCTHITHSLLSPDVLLCHDDELEGRRVAFILYLVPPWQSSDGGTLDLYTTDSEFHSMCVCFCVNTRLYIILYLGSQVIYNPRVLSSHWYLLWTHSSSLKFPQSLFTR